MTGAAASACSTVAQIVDTSHSPSSARATVWFSTTASLRERAGRRSPPYGSGDGQAEHEAAPVVRRLVEERVPAVGARQLTDDEEAETRALLVAAVRELVEQPRRQLV